MENVLPLTFFDNSEFPEPTLVMAIIPHKLANAVV